MLSRLRNTLATALSKRLLLLKFIVVILDANLLEWLSFEGCGVSNLIGKWVEWLAKEFNDMIKERKHVLPAKAKRDTHPQIYWVQAVQHKFLPNNQARCKLNICMESVMKLYSTMRCIKLKEVWEYSDTYSVVNGRFTPEGLSKYWKSIDSAIKFNVVKHDEFLTCEKFRKIKAKRQAGIANNIHSNNNNREGTTTPTPIQSRLGLGQRDPLPEFFRKYRSKPYDDKFRWRNKNNNGNNRRILPNLSERK